jgi:hypothetical protein
MGFASLYPSYKKTRLRILAARGARRDEIGDALEKRRGRRESRVPSAPAIVRTGDRKVRRNTRPSLRNGFTAYSALSLETNSSCLHR